MRMEVCGCIASGKTTITKIMESVGVDVVFESFNLNPYWAPFYQNPEKYNFEAELSFALQHYHQIKRDARHGRIVICDYSFVLDKAYAEIGLSDIQKKAFNDVCDVIQDELRKPDIILYLLCDVDIAYARMRVRGRSQENLITKEFLKVLDGAIKRKVDEVSDDVKIISVNSGELDVLNNQIHREMIIELITQNIKGKS